MSVWQGRTDAAEGSLGRRWHQADAAACGRYAASARWCCSASPATRALPATRARIGRGRWSCRDTTGMCATCRCTNAIALADARRHRLRRRCARIGANALVEARAAQLDAGRFPIVLGGGHEMALALSVDWPRMCRASNWHAAHRHRQLRCALRSAAGCSGPTSGTPFLQIARDCEARGWPFRYGCFGVSRYSNTRSAVRARQRASACCRCLDEAIDPAHTAHGAAGFHCGVDHVYLTFCLDVLPACVAPGVSAPAVRGVGLDIVEPLIDR